MRKERLDIGKIGLVRETECGRIVQIGLTENQSEQLQIFLSILSKQNALVELGSEHDLILKRDIKR